MTPFFSCQLISEYELVDITHHRHMDACPPQVTLFLHEDILVHTLAYEQDLHQWRVAELQAGRGDPGRPPYKEVELF